MKISSLADFILNLILKRRSDVFRRKCSQIYRYPIEPTPIQPMMFMTLMMDEFGQQQHQPVIMF